MIKNKIVKTILSTTILALLPFLSSCKDSFLFDNEGDCSVKVQFVFTKHRQALQSVDGTGADAFTNTVESVHLFVLDSESGELIYEKTDKVSNLRDGSVMPVALPNGRYTFIAWCGLDSNDENNAFELKHNYTRNSGDRLHLKRVSDTEPVHNAKYDAVYHGTVRDFIVSDNTINDVVRIELTKNTNDITVWIQHPESTFEEGDYTVSYEDANGAMNFHDNAPLDEDKVMRYKPYSTSILTTTSQYNGDEMEAGAMIARLSVARLLASHKESARMVVRDREGNEVFSIPFLQYLLEMQTYTGETRAVSKTEQWYLDCEDNFNCSFYVTGDNGLWTANRIIINNWVKVPDQNEGM